MPYQGNTVTLLTQALHEMNTTQPRQPYDNFVSIIQSSGTGKSRLVHETAKVIFTLPFNLRSEKDKSGMGHISLP